MKVTSVGRWSHRGTVQRLVTSGGRWTPRKLVDTQLLLGSGWPYVSIPFTAPRPDNPEDPEEAVAGTTL